MDPLATAGFAVESLLDWPRSPFARWPWRVAQTAVTLPAVPHARNAVDGSRIYFEDAGGGSVSRGLSFEPTANR